MSVADPITRTFCAEPGCDDVKDVFSAYCQSEGHQQRVVEYVPAEQIAKAVRALERIAAIAVDGPMAILPPHARLSNAVAIAIAALALLRTDQTKEDR